MAMAIKAKIITTNHMLASAIKGKSSDILSKLTLPKTRYKAKKQNINKSDAVAFKQKYWKVIFSRFTSREIERVAKKLKA